MKLIHFYFKERTLEVMVLVAPFDLKRKILDKTAKLFMQGGRSETSILCNASGVEFKSG